MMDGVPIWLKAVAYRPAGDGEHWIGSSGILCRGRSTRAAGYVLIVEPNNPYNVYDLNEVPVPDGYERDGNGPEEWYRYPMHGEKIISRHSFTADAVLGLWPEANGRRIIIRPIRKKKRVLVVEWELPEGVMPGTVTLRIATDRSPNGPTACCDYSCYDYSGVPYRIEEREA